MTIAGSDSGGGAGIQADLRTFAMLGVHGCVAVAAVTVQNSVGVKGFHEIPLDVITGQIEAVVDDIGIQAAKTGHAGVVGDHRGRRRDVARRREHRRAAGRRPGVRLDARRPAAAPVGAGRPSQRTLSAGHAGHAEPRRGAAHHRTSTSSTPPPSATRRGPCTPSGPKWALVKGGHLRSSSHSPDLLFDGTDFHEFDAERIDTAHDHGAGDTLAAATACALAHGYSVPDAVAFAKRWVTECLRAAYPLGHGHGPVSALFRLEHDGPRRHRGRRARTGG